MISSGIAMSSMAKAQRGKALHRQRRELRRNGNARKRLLRQSEDMAR